MNFDKDIVAPLAVALVSWLVKDYIFALVKKRQDALRAEWSDRLKSFWSPMFFWIGASLVYEKSHEKAAEAVKALEDLLSKNAHLLPDKHYMVIVKLIEKLTTLPERALTIEEVQSTKSYIKKQIELLNFLLYKKDVMFDPRSHTAMLGSQQAFLRLISQTIVHTAAWGLLGIYMYLGVNWYLEDRLIPLGLLLSPLAVAVWRDVLKRLQMKKELNELST